jgi:hypothetical protein
MGIANNFPVFEADQVLSNKHLNDLFNYLDQQERSTRCKLIGSGIVCGLNITYSGQGIHVSKGSALTSQGFLLLHCENDYSHYIPYTAREFPKDLGFISQCADTQAGTMPFYKPGFENELLELITANTFEGLDTDEKPTATALSTVAGADLDKYAVVAFLETEELKLKNCDTNDCNDKGSRMDFDVRILLVKKTTLDETNKIQSNGNTDSTSAGNEVIIQLKRYNVPVNNLNSSSDVLNAFASLTDDTLLKKLGQSLSDCYTNNKYLLENEPQNPFTDLFQTLRQLREKIIATSPVLIQYFYDFIDDLIRAYHEFMHELRGITTECCGDEMRFPLHIMLGEANVTTATGQHSAYRQYFTYSSLFDPEGEKLNTISFLFARLKLMVAEFSFTDITDFEKRILKVTPSRYGNTTLSKRCIPYYYKITDPGKELYRNWNYHKAASGRSKSNLSYNASQYSNADPVVNPLLYDIEKFDFFRVEGHIGKPVNDAIVKAKQLQQKYNLPFDIIALSADYIGALIKGEEPECVIQDLESDYRVLIAEFVCRVHDALCLASKVKYTGRATVFPPVIKTPILNATLAAGLRLMTRTSGTVEAFAGSGIAGAATATPATTLATTTVDPVIADDDDEDKLVISAINRFPDATDHIFVSTLVNEYHAAKKYQKGDTLSRLCNPDKGLVGNKYISIIKVNNGEFKNPIAFHGLVPISGLQYELFEFIDRIESVFRILMSNELADLVINDFKTAFNRLETEVKTLKNISPRIATEVEMTFDSCIVERLEALKNEYLRRTAEYRLAKNFNYYFKNHGGIEHKAGVPKGGTFILVYHEERKQRFVDVRSLVINKQLSTLMMSHFQALLKPAVKLNHLEYQSNLLQTATLYKEPELYLRFKDVMQKYLDECQDLPEDRRKEITTIINKPPEQNKFELTNEMVIADFYVPYLCCSDCPPIAYILAPPAKEETPDPTITMNKDSFCNDDKAPTNIDPKPAGGELTGEGVSKINDQFVFIPLGLAAGPHSITYKVNDKSITRQVTVIAAPKAKFSSAVDKVGTSALIMKFTNETDDAAMPGIKYQWLTGGNVFSEEKNATREFPLNTLPVEVTLRANNGGCPNEFTDTVKKPAEAEQRVLTVCSKETKRQVEDVPPGSVVKVIKDGGIIDNSLVIRPADLKLKATKSFDVSYVLNNRQINVTITILVANADFTIQLVRIGVNGALSNAGRLGFILKPIGASVTKSWTITQGGGKFTGIADGQTVDPTAHHFSTGNAILITHEAVTTQDGVSCPDTKTFNLTTEVMDKMKPPSQPFDNNFTL